MDVIPSELIKKKKSGEAHTADEIRWIVRAFTAGELPDYQMAAWAMAVWFKGMTDDEIAVLTEAMRDSGEKFDFKKLRAPRIDKHSTGGVGDKTTLIIVPLLAAAGVHVPMIAGRGLGHTGGTIDKLESISGFRVDLTRQEFENYVANHYAALIGQTENICPADRKLYALRDVTSTIDSLPLICGSIMSKKLVEDLTGLVLDIKFGSGAFMKTVSEATTLATLLKSTGEKNGVRVTALITNMNEPLGRYSGNAVEVKECLDILSNRQFLDQGLDFYEPTRKLSLELAAHMLWLAEKAPDVPSAYALAEKILESGRALEEFHALVQRQGGRPGFTLPEAKYSETIVAPRGGILRAINTEKIGLAGIEIRAGRKTAADTLDYAAGIETLCRVGRQIEKNQPLFRIFADSEAGFSHAKLAILSAIDIGDTPPKEILPLVAKVLV